MTDDDGNVIAVLDWEICTLGDPLADVGLLMVYWTEADDAAGAARPRPPPLEGFLDAPELLDATPSASGRDLVADRLLHRVRLLEARLHRRGRVRPLRRRRDGRRRPPASRASPPRSSAAPRRPPRPWRGSAERRMTSLYELVERPDLESPGAGHGPRRAGSTPASAPTARAEVLVEQLERRTVARFDADALLDWRARRPVMRLVDGINTQLSRGRRPSSAGPGTTAGNDLLLLLGTEPDHAWLAFSEQVVDLAVDLGARLVRRPRRLPGAGAAHAPAAASPPRRRPPSSAAGLRARPRSRCPPGVQGMIERRAPRCGASRPSACGPRCPTTSPAMPYPAASLALLETASAVGGLRPADADLAERARREPRIGSTS